MDKSIAILIPCYNEELTIGSVIEDFQKNLPQATIYVYDNNSSDNTAKIASSYSAVVVKPSPIQGKGAVIRQMLHEIDADVYLMVDGDATYSAQFAKDIVAGVVSGEFDMVLGDRLSGTYYYTNTRPMHGFGNRLVKRLVNKKFHGNLEDIMTGYRAFNREIAKDFVPVNDGFEIETELSIYALTNDKKVGSVIVSYEDRPEGSKSKLHTIKDGWRVIRYIYRSAGEYKHKKNK